MKKRLFIFIIGFISCGKKEFSISNLSGNRITAMGHAGMGIDSNYPMNSMEGILKCLNLGMDGTEFDVQMTKDSILVLYHGEDLSNETNLSGTINSMNWEEVKKARYNETPFLNYSIVSLEQLFSSVKNLDNYQFTFDCKLYTKTSDVNYFFNNYINAINKIVHKYQLQNNVYIEASSIDFLNLFKIKNPQSKLFINPPNFNEGLQLAMLNGYYGITISTRNVSKEQIAIAHENQLRVAIWNIHFRSDNIEAIEKNPDFIQTDNVKNLVKLLKK